MGGWNSELKIQNSKFRGAVQPGRWLHNSPPPPVILSERRRRDSEDLCDLWV